MKMHTYNNPTKLALSRQTSKPQRGFSAAYFNRYVLTGMKKLTLILFAFALASCKIDTDKFINPNETLQVYIYGTELNVEEYLLNPGDEKYNKFISWIRNNKEGWSSTPATYVPRILVSGKSFTMNFMDDVVLINYADGQFTKKIDPKEYEFLKR